MKVSELTREAQYVSPDSYVPEAAEALITNKVSAVFVGKPGKVEGIITERDLLRFVSRCNSFGKTKVRAVMSKPVITISGSKNIIEAGKLMESQDVRHLAVLDEADEIIGMITAKMISRNQVRVWYGKTLFD